MAIKLLNDNILLESDQDYMLDVDNPEIDRIVRNGTILLPEFNMLKKIPEWWKIVSLGNKCNYKFKKGQRVRIQFRKGHKPMWFNYENIKYRIVKETDIDLVEEE